MRHNRPQPERIFFQDTTWVGVPLQAFAFDGSTLDPSEFPGVIALLPEGAEPDDDTVFKAGTWHQRLDDNDDLAWFLDVLAGPAGAIDWPVTSGHVALWYQINAAPEQRFGKAPVGVLIYET